VSVESGFALLVARYSFEDLAEIGGLQVEFEKYQQYQTDKLHGRILTPDGLRVICAGLDNDPEKIGIHMLEMLAKFRNEGIAE